MLPPSSKWQSLEPWDFDGMKERLESHVQSLDTCILKQHVQEVIGEPVTLSTPFSAGQYWVCFEFITADGRLVIARVRLPRHPSLPPTYVDEDELYQINCEVATMNLVRQKLSRVKVPHVFAYEAPGSDRAAAVGAAYMLLEGFYGNTLLDVEFDLCNLPVRLNISLCMNCSLLILYKKESTQEHIFRQWTSIQAEIATLTLPCIGSVTGVSADGEPVVGKLATAKAEGLADEGPFLTTAAYFNAVADAAIRLLPPADDDTDPTWEAIGKHVFCDIVKTTGLYTDSCNRFPLNHMDMGTQNILVDDDFNFVAVIDWEFAQTAPWSVNYFPMPFPLTDTDTEIKQILQDSKHIAHKNVAKQELTRKLYVRQFEEAERALREAGRGLSGSFAATLTGKPSRVYSCFTKLGDMPESDEYFARAMIQVAFDYDAAGMDSYLQGLKEKARQHMTDL